MANGIIDYNGFQIASGALDDGTLEFMRQRGLLPPVDGGASQAPQSLGAPTSLLPSEVVSGTGLRVPKISPVQGGNPFQAFQGDGESVPSFGGRMADARAIGLGPQGFGASIPEAEASTPNRFALSNERPSPLAPLAPEPMQPETMAEERELAVAAEAPRSVTPESPLRQRSPEEMMIEGVTGNLRNEANVAGRSADIYEKLRVNREQMIADNERRKSQLEESRAKLDEDRLKAREEYDAAEPTGYWEGKPTGERVLAGLAIGLGAFGSALSGSGRNIAYDIITDEINRDTAIQKEKREKLKGKVEDVDNQYDRLFKIYQNDSLVENELFNLRAEDAVNYLEQIKLEGVQDNVKNQIDMTVGKLQQDIQDRRFNQLQQLAELQKKQSEAGLSFEPSKDVRERFVPGVGIAKDKESAAKAIEVSQGTFDQIDLIEELEQLTEGFQSVDPRKRALIGQKVSLLTGKLRVPVVGPGAFTDSERAFIQNDIVGNPASLTSLDSITLQKLASLKDTLSRGRDRAIEAAGVRQFTPEESQYDSLIIRAGQRPAQGGQQNPQQAQLQQSLQAYESILQRDPGNADAKEAIELIKGQLGR
jgi:hypothetical protein